STYHALALLESCSFICFFCFFFQAEDGIRDFHVTGVQTCALPISRRARRAVHRRDDSDHVPVPRGAHRPYGEQALLDLRGDRAHRHLARGTGEPLFLLLAGSERPIAAAARLRAARPRAARGNHTTLDGQAWGRVRDSGRTGDRAWGD